MAKTTVSKKQYLRKLNRRLAKEAGVAEGVGFVFYPLGAKARAATGVAASEGAGPAVRAVMDAVQARGAAKYAVDGAILGNGKAAPIEHAEPWPAASGGAAGAQVAGKD